MQINSNKRIYITNTIIEIKIVKRGKSVLTDFSNLSAVASVPTKQIEEIKQDSKWLKEYILNLIKLEMNIYSLEKRLAQLYYQKAVYDKNANFASNYPLFEKKQVYDDCIRLQKQYQVGKLPMSQPIAPIEPVLKTPGFFNKKKVLEENALLQEEYQKALQSYEKELKEYEVEKKSLLAETAERVEELKFQLENFSPAENTSLPEVQFKNRIGREVKETEDMLRKTYKCRNELYALDIIFGKYRNVVALSTFYEYSMSGRCATLEGADGAYNIYEQEYWDDCI